MNNFLEGEIQIWVIDLDSLLNDLPRLKSILSVDEMTRSARYRYLPVCQHFILARGALRMICSQYLDSDPRDVVFGYGEHGKPFISQPNTAIQFNLTHSDGLALAAFTNNIEIGIDIETIRPIAEMEIMVADHFSPLERAQFEQLPEYLKPVNFFNSWTRKEAYVKGRGRGFSLPFNQFSIGMLPGHPVQLLQDGLVESRVDVWQLMDLVLSDHEEYKAALAYRSPENCRLTYHVFYPSDIQLGRN